jgi:hypothetical protein
MHTDIHAMSGIRTHNPSIRALDRAATVIAQDSLYACKIWNSSLWRSEAQFLRYREHGASPLRRLAG